MDSLVMCPSPDQSFSSYKSHIRNCKKTILRATDFYTSGSRPHFPHRDNKYSELRRRVEGLRDQAWTTAYQNHRDQSSPTAGGKSKNNNQSRDQNSPQAFKKPKASTNSTTSVTKFVSNDNTNVNSTTNNVYSVQAVQDHVDKFSGSVVSILSPPPSSLPLPTFSLRPKHSCNAEAARLNTGATENLRRLLRLQ